MKLFVITTSFISVAIALTNASDVTYSVIAFPGSNNVAVSVGGQEYTLQKNPLNTNIFTGVAPFGADYRYTILTSPGQANPENTTRHLVETVTNTGHEFFGRSKTVHEIPALPRAYNPIYPGKIYLSI